MYTFVTHVYAYVYILEDSRWGLSYNHGYAFTTYDSDNDKDSVLNCAVHHHGAWWYRACTFANLNGEYMVPGKSYRQSAFYYAFDHYHSLKSIEMKFRRIH